MTWRASNASRARRRSAAPAGQKSAAAPCAPPDGTDSDRDGLKLGRDGRQKQVFLFGGEAQRHVRAAPGLGCD